MEVPSTEWRAAPWDEAGAVAQAPVASRWRLLPGVVRHTFTHFHLEVQVLTGDVKVGVSKGGVWVLPEALKDHALPTVMKKIIAHARGGRKSAG
jgi:A/G-specific adenine glycosylase